MAFSPYEPINRSYEEQVGGRTVRCSVVHHTFTHGKKEYLIKQVLRYSQEGKPPTESIHSIMEAVVPFEGDAPDFAKQYVRWDLGGRKQWRIRLLHYDSEEFKRVATAFLASRGQRL